MPVYTDWSTYRHPTDAGILGELLERQGDREVAPAIEAVRDRFLRLLSASFAADPACCREIPGAAALLRYLRVVPQSAIATGGWADSARLKLRQAAIDIDSIPFASSDDSPSREHILRTVRERAVAKCGGSFDSVTYVGDAPWDVAAARLLGFRFIGISCEGNEEQLRLAGATVVFRDLRNRDAIVQELLAG